MYGAEKQGVIHHFLSIFVRTPPMLAWTSPQGLVLPSAHANSARIIPSRRRPCWRGPPRKALFHRQATPTVPGLSRAGAAHVGVGLSARPCFTVKPRQHRHRYPEPAPPMLASASPQGLVPPSSHANRATVIPSRRRPCWRGPPRKASFHRRSTPTGPGFSRAGAAHVGVGLPARPCSTVKPRQQCHRYPEPAPPMLAWTSPQGLVSPPCHANRARIILSRRRPCWRGPPRKALIHRQATPTWAFAIDIRF